MAPSAPGINAKPETPINVNYNVTQQGSAAAGGASSARTAMALSKPAMMGIGLLGLGTVAVGLLSVFKVPGLEDQIKDLEAEVDRLTVEVDQLSEQNDIYEELNEDLNETLADLIVINDKLNETATSLENEVDSLNGTVTNLTIVVDELEDEEERLKQIESDLESAQQRLEIELVVLEQLNKTWTELNENLTASVNDLQEEVVKLENTSEVLTNISIALETENDQLNETNIALTQYISDVETLSVYLDNTGQTTDDTLTDIVNGLASSIQQSRVLTFQALELYYTSVTDGWYCRNQDFFINEPMYNNQSFPIFVVSDGTLEPYFDLLDVVDERMLKLMCLRKADFNQFVTYNSYPNLSHGEATLLISYDNVETSVSAFSTLAFDWYGLGNSGCGADCGVNQTVWEEAGFDCRNVPQFRWTRP